ncbi:LysR substrate-binding domain-containing protein [Ralstonia pseudosolanacearum]|uniref:histidine kinase n=1 Tax=Ralstonia pseudosolanacearum TaxID=1310165 RepID=UPI003CF8B644
MDETRPNPDTLLAELQSCEEKAARGKLRIYFGASAGVGKTYAMLSAAKAARAEGIDVVVGLVETHGRAETAALVEGLEHLPPRQVEYRGRTLPEFDLDAALARKPALVLVDELAHSNVAGSRHPKRWQDIEDLLAAGIDVWTTVNVQHLDSLNEAVGSITGIRVWETVPDAVFDSAAEVILVDLPADELLRRLAEGKVYLPEQARHAARNFFRKGNLIALREAAIAGLGFAVLPLHCCHAALSEGRLRTVLRAWTPEPADLHALYPSRAGVPPSVRALVSFLRECFAAEPTMRATA